MSIRSDVAEILERAREDLLALAGKHLLVTGGTGFFGKWLLHALAAAHREMGVEISVTALSRHPEVFRHNYPDLAHAPGVSVWQADVVDFVLPGGTPDYVIHAAAPISGMQYEHPVQLAEILSAGTARVFGAVRGAESVLLVSSGAVYGNAQQGPLSEDMVGGDPPDPRHVYAHGKRMAEAIAAAYHEEHGLNVKIARCFAFVGPYQPLEASFAVTSFLRDALAGRAPRLASDGTASRSYMYPTDLVVWLLRILVQGQAMRPYNVGSDRAVSIADLARMIGQQFAPGLQVVVPAGVPADMRQHYVPDIARARAELGLNIRVDLPEALKRTFDWHRSESILFGLEKDN